MIRIAKPCAWVVPEYLISYLRTMQKNKRDDKAAVGANAQCPGFPSLPMPATLLHALNTGSASSRARTSLRGRQHRY